MRSSGRANRWREEIGGCIVARIMRAPSLPRFALLVLLSACSSGSTGPTTAGDAGLDSSPLDSAIADSTTLDSTTDDSAPVDSAAADSPFDAPVASEGGDGPSVVVTGGMGLFEIAGMLTTSPDAGPVAGVVLQARASFHAPLTHDFDDRTGGLGCFADHFDATTKPAPTDDDAGLLRVSGYVGGASLTSGSIAQPVSCTRGANGFYACAFPSGASTTSVLFPPSASPLGAGAITFGTNGGANFGAVQTTATPLGSLAVTEDLTSIHYLPTADATIGVTCTSCASARVAVRLEAYPAADASVGWPYSTVGIVDCVFENGGAVTAPVTVPAAAVSAMFATDAAIDTVKTTVTTLPSMPGTSTDQSGNPLSVNVGRGVFGIAPR